MIYADCIFPEGAFAGWLHSDAEVRWLMFVIACAAANEAFGAGTGGASGP